MLSKSNENWGIPALCTGYLVCLLYLLENNFDFLVYLRVSEELKELQQFIEKNEIKIPAGLLASLAVHCK